MSDLNALTDAKLVRGLIDLIYPVGSDIFNESADFNPNQLYPNTTWERIYGVMPVGVKEDDADFNKAGKIGGNKYHTQTIEEMPNHGHSTVNISHDQNWRAVLNRILPNIDTEGWPSAVYVYPSNGLGTTGVGGGQPMNIMNPYRATYWWHRTK